MRSGTPARRRLTPALLVMAMVAALLPLGQAATAATNNALQFDGVNDHVTFGAATSTLGTTTMTLELWFKRTAEGVATGTGSGGLTAAVPLLTKGRSENDTPANVNANYFLGINTNGTAGNLTDDRLGRGLRRHRDRPEPSLHRHHRGRGLQRLAPRRRHLRRQRLARLPRRGRSTAPAPPGGDPRIGARSSTPRSGPR